VDPPALWVFVRHPLAPPRRAPAMAGRRRGGGAALVEVDEVQQPGLGPARQVVRDRPGAGRLVGVLLVLDGAGRAAVARAHVAEMAADLARAGLGAAVPKGLGELGGSPGAALAEQVAERTFDVLAAGRVGGRPAAAGDEGIPAAVAVVLEDVQGRAIA